MDRWTKFFDPLRRLWPDQRKWPMVLLPLATLYLLDCHLAPSWVFPHLKRTRSSTQSILQGQEELVVEGITISEESPLACCRSEEEDLDLDYLTFAGASLATGSGNPQSFGKIRYLSPLFSGEGEPCRTSFTLFDDEARDTALRFSQPELPPSNNFRLVKIQLTESDLAARLQTARGPDADIPGQGCLKRLLIDNKAPEDDYAPLIHKIEMATGGEVRFRLQRLPQVTPQRAALSNLWPVDLLNGVKARSVRIVDSGNRTKIAFGSRRGKVALQINSLKLGAAQMEVNIQIPSLVEGLKTRPVPVGLVLMLFLAVNGGLIAFVWSLAQPEIQRSLGSSPVRIFVSYSGKDTEYLEKILDAVKGLEKEGFVFWWDKKLVPGTKWKTAIQKTIELSDIALLLVSQRFLDSDNCIQEVNLAKKKTLVPIILSRCEWERHEWLREAQHFPGKGMNIKETYQDPGGPEQLELDIRKVLREHAKEIGAKRSAGLPRLRWPWKRKDG